MSVLPRITCWDVAKAVGVACQGSCCRSEPAEMPLLPPPAAAGAPAAADRLSCGARLWGRVRECRAATWTNMRAEWNSWSRCQQAGCVTSAATGVAGAVMMSLSSIRAGLAVAGSSVRDAFNIAGSKCMEGLNCVGSPFVSFWDGFASCVSRTATGGYSWCKGAIESMVEGGTAHPGEALVGLGAGAGLCTAAYSCFRRCCCPNGTPAVDQQSQQQAPAPRVEEEKYSDDQQQASGRSSERPAGAAAAAREEVRLEVQPPQTEEQKRQQRLERLRTLLQARRSASAAATPNS